MVSHSSETPTLTNGQENNLPSSKKARPWYLMSHGGRSAAGSKDASPAASVLQTSAGALAAFLHDDIRPEGHRLLLPFLTTRDLLRLSESSKGLVGYRHHLSQVMIVSQPSPSPSVKRGLLRLLLDQEGKGLQHLRLSDVSMLHVLDLAAWGCFEGLKVLELPWTKHSGEHKAWRSLVEALAGGWLKDVEEIDLSRTRIGDEQLGEIMEALGKGACPNLRRLDLRQAGLTDCRSIARAMSTGSMQALQRLDLSQNLLNTAWFLSLCHALDDKKCPDLRQLDLSSCNLGTTAIDALANALAVGVCPNLEELALGGNSSRVASILRAMQAGGCPGLKRLHHIGSGLEEGVAFHGALASGNCSRFEVLVLHKPDSHVVSHVLQAMSGGVVLPHLTKLDLSYARIAMEEGVLLGQALSRRACPALEVLELSGNRHVDVKPIMEALQGGACPMLRELGLHRLGMSWKGGMALALALRSGWLKNLTRLKMGDNSRIGDKAMTAIVEALSTPELSPVMTRHCWIAPAPAFGNVSPGAFLNLSSLSVDDTGMGFCAGEVILRALDRGVWPHLEMLELVNDSLPEDFIPWLCMVLSRRGVGLQRLEILGLFCPGQDAMMELRHAFRGGACPALEYLYISLGQLEEGTDRRIMSQELKFSHVGRRSLDVDVWA